MEPNETPFQAEVKVDKLTLERQFSVVTFNEKVDKMSREQAQDMLKTLHYNMHVQQMGFAEIMKRQWHL